MSFFTLPKLLLLLLPQSVALALITQVIKKYLLLIFHLSSCCSLCKTIKWVQVLNWHLTEQLLDAQRKKKRSIAGIDQDELKDPTNLADSDSFFCEFRGVNIHHKVYDVIESKAEEAVSSQTKKVGFPMILLHGFGASVFSWNKVMKPLAEVSGSKVLAFDRPAFGLTSRLNPFDHSASSGNGDAKPLNLYSMAFSVLATLYFVDHLVAEKAILVGYVAFLNFVFG